jgi:hypothetical protein
MLNRNANLYMLTSVELDRARDAVEHLLSIHEKTMNGLDQVLAVKLDTLRADLMNEHEDRSAEARS